MRKFIGTFLLLFVLSNTSNSQSVCLLTPFTHTFQTLANPMAMAKGDVNNDGREDIIVTYQYNNSIQTFLGNVASVFSTPLTGTMPAVAAKLLKLADINNDGNLDIIAAYNSSANFTIKYGNGTGAFPTATTITTPGFSTIQDFTIADYNNDSNKDILFQLSSMGTGYLGNGAGSFTNTGSSQYGETGDFNNDNFLDLITPNGPGTLAFVPGNGSGYFFNPVITTTYSSVYSSQKLHVVDFNNDGNMDLISNSNINDVVEFLAGSGTGSFSVVSTLTFSSQVTIYPVDLDNDSKVDILLRHNISGNNISYQVFKNINGVNFADHGYYGGLWPLFDDYGYAFTDVNGDNMKEIIIGNKSINAFHIRYSATNCYPKLPTVLNEDDINVNTPIQVRVADIDNDNRNDILSMDGVYISIFKNNGQGFDPVVNYPVNSGQWFGLYDINNDGMKDIVFTQTNDSVARMLNNGSGVFGTKVAFKTGNNTKKFVCTDANNDGKPDLIVTNANDNNIRTLLGNGTGGFTATIISAVPGGNFPNDIDAGDFNGDGIADVAIGKQGGSLTTMIGSGSGSFFSAINYSAVGIAASGVLVSDFNNDGKKDLVSLSSGGNINIYTGNGGGSFTITNTYVTSPTMYAISVKDLNMDGNVDIIGTTNSGLSIMRGAGNGSFTTTNFPFSSIYLSGATILNSEVEDLNGDFLPDIVSSNLSISLNAGAFINSASTLTLCSGGNITVNAYSGSNSFTWTPGGSTSSSFTISSPGNYYITTTNPYNGCVATSATISVASSTNTAPVLTITPSQGTVCTGQSASINVSGANTYSWNTGSTQSTITVMPLNTTTYVVTGTSTNACTSTSVITINVALPPQLIATTTNSALCAGQTTSISVSGANTYTWNTGSTQPSITVSPTVTATYGVTGTATNGCSSATTTSITVFPLPQIIVSPTAATLCAGASTTLNASGASTYTWTTGSNGPNITITPSISAQYTVSGTSTVGCTNYTTVTVTLNTVPNVTVASSPTLICAGQSATLTAGGANSYSWNINGNNAVQIVSPSVTTTYSVTGASAAGCTASSAITLSVSACTGMKLLGNDTRLFVYPNPFLNAITVELNGQHGRVEIFNSIGELVYESNDLKELKTRINLENCKRGVYFLKVDNHYFKIIKE